MQKGGDDTVKCVLDYLAIGKETAITAREIAALMDVGIRDVTKEINTFRKRGTLICGNAFGYFYPSTAEDIKEFCQRTNSRIEDMQSIVRPAERYLEDRIMLRAE